MEQTNKVIERRISELEKAIEKIQQPTHWTAAVPKWLFSASFAVVVILILVLLFTGKEFTYQDKFGFRSPQFSVVEKKPEFGVFKKLGFDKVEKAETDGLVVATLVAHGNVGGIARLEVVAGENLNPESLRGAQSITAHPQSNWARGQGANLVVPVRGGEYFKVRVTGDMQSSAFSVYVSWAPFS